MTPVSGADAFSVGPAAPEYQGHRLDAWLSRQHPALSRVRWQDLIKSGHVTIRGESKKPNYSVQAGDLVDVIVPPVSDPELVAQDIAIDILHEDADLIVINKPPGLVVHPAPGHSSGTLVNALLHHCHDLAGVGGEKRPGIVHRLDRDTSGVLVAAKNDAAMLGLAAQFKDRSTRKEYVAVVWGKPSPATGTIRTTIGRDPVNRQKMSTRSTRGRSAVSHYRILEWLGLVSFVGIAIETGRTHQIRVHMAHIKNPIVGDEVYGRKHPPELPVPVTRQLLHAWRLTIRHPSNGATMTFEAPWPEDMNRLVKALKPL